MDPERWRQIVTVFDAALERPEGDRAQFLDQACRDDEALRREVDSLLAAPSETPDFLAVPAVHIAAAFRDSDPLTDAVIGREFGAYRIVSLLGVGGMGQVFRARDTRLGRDVAIKMLPNSVAHDPDRLQRLEREARVLAALNHPHIAGIYDVEEADGIRGLVLELVEGQTLAERIAAGPIPVAEALRIAQQIANALEAAHAKGIIHRDLKPANIKVTTDGVVKVLDFGIAKMRPREIASDAPRLAQLTDAASQGALVGTPAYMSPEQARGLSLDTRTDIWALGCVLFEMLTGTAAFRGGSFVETISRVLEGEPDWTRLPHDLPFAVQDLLRRSLRKDIDQRIAEIGLVRREIEACLMPVALIAPRWSTSRTRRALRNGSLVLAIVTLAAVIALQYGGRWSRGGLTAVHAAPFENRDWLLIAELDNQTGERVFDQSLNTALSVSIGQSSYVNVVSATRIRDALTRMKRPADQRLDVPTAREVAEREGVKLVLAPALTKIGGSYLLSAHLVHPQSGAEVRTLSVRADRADTILSAVDELTSSIRRSLGEATAAVERQSKPLSRVTTSSLEALRLYSAGYYKFVLDSNIPEALALYGNALRIDPSFTSAKAQLGMLQWQFGNRAIAKSLLGDAVLHADELTDLERYYILAFHSNAVQDDPLKATEYWKAAVALYPDVPGLHHNLARMYHQAWRLDEAVGEYKTVLKLDPYQAPSYYALSEIYLYDLGEVQAAIRLGLQQVSFNDRNSYAYDHLGWAYLGADDLASAGDAFQKALAIVPAEKREQTLDLYRLGHTLRLQRRYPEATQAFLKIKDIDASEIDPSYHAGVVTTLAGDPTTARAYFQRFRSEVERDLQKDPANAGKRFDYAIALVRLGERNRARAEVSRALRIPRSSQSDTRSPMLGFPSSTQPQGKTTEAPDTYFDLARFLTVMGETDAAIDALGKAVEKGYRNYIWMKVIDDLSGLHDQPRFERLVSGGLKGPR
jgi:serine/threonine protein kinase/tetratricopeptide (TPR) repeat protein